MRAIWVVLGFLAMGCAALGVALPLLPTTPFLIAAAYCFARSSKRLHEWLLSHRYFGPLIEHWRTHGAISRPAKVSAGFALGGAFAISLWLGVSNAVLVVQAVVLVIVAVFIFSRPSPPRAKRSRAGLPYDGSEF